jgi:hypothetical protein
MDASVTDSNRRVRTRTHGGVNAPAYSLRTVVWQGSAGDRGPYADLTPKSDKWHLHGLPTIHPCGPFPSGRNPDPIQEASLQRLARYTSHGKSPCPKRVLCPPSRDRLGELYAVRRRLHMGPAIFVAIFLPVFVAIFLPLILSGKQWRAEQDRGRARRLAEHRMNARLLRLNI